MQTAHQAQRLPRWKRKIFSLFRLNVEPVIQLYYGYGHNGCVTIFGHVLQLSAFPRKRYRRGVIRNTLALLRLFMVKPLAGAEISISWKGKQYKAQSDTDGFFKVDWEDPEMEDAAGWYEVEATGTWGKEKLPAEKGSIYFPHKGEYIFISDIDDTFLVSHSSNLRKRLLVLFTNNARSRQPFEGVVRHYQLLQKWNTGVSHPFFYVSSSEWNLYDYLAEFTEVNHLPKGIFLLNQLKQFSQLLKTGQNHHHTKFARIVRIMEAYPERRVVLLGDSSQQDPYIYEAVVKHFPKQVHAVYIRDIQEKHFDAVSGVLANIEAAGVPCCFFKHSQEAILHSIKIGLIPPEEGTDSNVHPKNDAYAARKQSAGSAEKI